MTLTRKRLHALNELLRQMPNEEFQLISDCLVQSLELLNADRGLHDDEAVLAALFMKELQRRIASGKSTERMET